MSRFSESMLWPINGKYIRNDSGNNHVVGNDKILVPPIEPFKRCHHFGILISLAQQPSIEQFPAFI